MNKALSALCILLLFNTIASATDYYVSSSGNDTNNGLSTSSPWRTIQKVNSVFSTLKPGDKILFRRGDTFYGTINITKSGVSGSPITLGSYGTGDKPVITGFTTLSGWTNEGGGIFSKSVSSEEQINMVTVNGVQVAKGRYPDAGTNLTFESYTSSPRTITDNGLGDAINWTGAEAVININDWVLDRCLITAHNGDVLTYSNLGSGDIPYQTGRYYFIQNDIRCVTKENEWHHSVKDGKFYIYGDPSAKTVRISTINNLIYCYGHDYITIDGLELKGANRFAIFFVYGNANCIVRNCNISFIGENGINTDIGSSHTYTNNDISQVNRSGIFVIATNNCKILDNTIQDIGILPGTAFRATQSNGIYIYNGNDALIQYNSIINTAYNGIYFSGNNAAVRNNYINYPCMLLDDGAGIYTNVAGYTGRIISDNIILNSGVGNTNAKLAEGIYLDVFASNVTLRNNTIANCRYAGIKVHKGSNNIITGNTVFNNYTGIYYQNSSTSNTMTGHVMNNNIFFARTDSQFSLRFHSVANGITSFGTADNNVYARPVDDNIVFYTYEPATGAKYRDLAGWRSYTGQDLNSKKSPITLTDPSAIVFHYNATKSDRVISLSKPMIDAKGTKYSTSVTLKPYTSVILMPDPNPSQPAIPVYSSSVIENSAPTALTMTYNLSLANVVPSASAFTVRVNSSARTVSSVAIVSGKVRLTLSSPVSFGDVVTVAYTKPSTNPLQTSSGGQAESLSAKSVTNNCAPPVPVFQSAVVQNAAPSIIEMTYSLSLANIVPSASAFTVRVNSSARTVSSVAIASGKVRLTLASPVVYGNNVTVAYTKPSANPLQTSEGGQAASLTTQTVTNNCVAPPAQPDPPVVTNQPPSVSISNPVKGFKYTAPATVTIDAVASDPDGRITKVEFFNGTVKLAELTTAPYSFTWKDVEAGSYHITAVATDNMNASTTSSVIDIQVEAGIIYDPNAEIFNLYPNPNNGHFTIEFIDPMQIDNSRVTILSSGGQAVYTGTISREEILKEFDLSYLKPGIYVIMLTGSEIIVTKKFIRE